MFPSLLPRKKRHSEKRNVRVDDFVIMQSPNAVRGKWNLAASLTCTLDMTAECVMLRSRPAMENTRGPFPRLLLSTPQKAMMMTDCKEDES